MYIYIYYIYVYCFFLHHKQLCYFPSGIHVHHHAITRLAGEAATEPKLKRRKRKKAGFIYIYIFFLFFGIDSNSLPDR